MSDALPSNELVERLRRLSGGAKVVAGLAADEIERLQTQKTNLLSALDAKQAKIDALMLEFCHGEMSADKREELSRADKLRAALEPAGIKVTVLGGAVKPPAAPSSDEVAALEFLADRLTWPQPIRQDLASLLRTVQPPADAPPCNHGALSPRGTMFYHGFVTSGVNHWRCDACKGVFEGNLTEPNTPGNQALTLSGVIDALMTIHARQPSTKEECRAGETSIRPDDAAAKSDFGSSQPAAETSAVSTWTCKSCGYLNDHKVNLKVLNE